MPCAASCRATLGVDTSTARAGQRRELVGGDDAYLVSRLFQLAEHRPQGADDAVHLRLPCVGDDRNPHQAAALTDAVAHLAAISSAQWRISILPS